MGNERRIKMRRKENFELKIKHSNAPKPMALGWKVTIWTIVCILVVLLGMGIWAYGGRNVEASVGSQKITTKELESRVSMMINQQYPQDKIKQMTQDQIQQLYTSYREQTLQQLIQEKLFFEAAKREKITVTDEEYTTEAQNIITTQVKPQVTQQGQKWDEWLKQQGYKDETQLRDFIKLNSKDEINFTIYRKKLLDDPILNKIKITDEEANSYYLSIGAKKISHILIKYDSTKDKPEVNTQAKKTIDEIKAELAKDKTKFAEIAKAKSQDKQKDQSGKDAGSAVNGGDLGWYTVDGNNLVTSDAQGQTVGLVQEFNDVAMKLNKGDISEPVQTKFGWHIITVTDIKLRSESYNVSDGVRIGAIKFVTVGQADQQGNPTPLPAEEVKTKEKTANTILADLKAGRISFDEAVAKYSEDQISKKSGGEFPYGNDRYEKDPKKNKFWANLGEAQAAAQQGYPFDIEVVQAAMKGKPGTYVPTVIKTTNNLWVVKTIDYRPARKVSFEDAKDLVKKDMESTKKNDESQKWINDRTAEYGVKNGNAWKTFTTWWDRYVGSPLSDLGLWIKQFMGKGGSSTTTTPSTQTLPGGDTTTTPTPTPTDK